jgi:hypothetical protein
MAIQQFNLGAVFDQLAQQRAMQIQERGAAQQERMGALQMARYQREDEQAQRQQSALARLNTPGMDDAGRRSILEEAYPELLAKRVFQAPEYDMENGVMYDKRTGAIVGRDGLFVGDAYAPAPQAPQQAPQPTIAPGGRMPVPMPVQREELPAQRSYSEGVKAVENTTGNPNARNPRSTATGDGQFIEATWLDMMSRHAPGLTQGKSRQEILEMRGDPELAAKMTDLYGQENRAHLERNGIEATPALVYGAHHFGPAAAVRFAKASDDTTMEAVLGPDAIRANPQLAGMTVGQAKALLEKRFAGVAMPGGQAQPPQAQTEPTQAGSQDGWRQIKEGGAKSLGLAKAPDGMMWVGRRNPQTGQVETRLDPIPGSSARNLSAEEVEQAGLPKGTVAQVGPDGKIDVVNKGEDVDREEKRSKAVVELERNWRSDFKEPVKQSRELTSQVGIIRNALATKKGPGDIAGIIAFNKLLDPGAVVREADVALTLQAQGLGDRLSTWMANKQEGDVLPQPLRDEMLALSEQIYQTSNSYLRDGVMTYREAIEHGGGNFDRVLPPQMRKSLGWDDQPDPNAWEKVEIPPELTPAGRGQQPGQANPAGVPELPPGFRIIGG